MSIPSKTLILENLDVWLYWSDKAERFIRRQLLIWDSYKAETLSYSKEMHQVAQGAIYAIFNDIEIDIEET